MSNSTKTEDNTVPIPISISTTIALQSLSINHKKDKLNQYLSSLSSSLSSLKNSKNRFDIIITDTLQQAKEYKTSILLHNQRCLNEKKFERLHQTSNEKQIISAMKPILENLNALNEWFILAEEETKSKEQETATLTQDQIKTYLNTVIKVLEMTSFVEYYINNFWQFVHLKYIYKVMVQYSPVSNEATKKTTWKTKADYVMNNINECKYVEVTLIKRRKNSSITNLVIDIRNNYYKDWIMRMDEQHNVLIKGELKGKYLRFENYILASGDEFKNIAYIHLKVYFTLVDLLSDYSSEYDKATFKPEVLSKMTNSYVALERIRGGIANKNEKYNEYIV